MNRYSIQKHILQWLLSETSSKIRSTIEKDDRFPLFQRTWKRYFSKRLERRKEAKKNLRIMFINLVISTRSFDNVIQQMDSALNYFWVPNIKNISKPVTFKKYRFRQSSKEPNDSHVTLFDDLFRETEQRGTRGKKAKKKLRNLCFCCFYIVACRKDTYMWLKKLLDSM